ncbi:hypothetical protein KUV26_06005 [Leisingera daeponensis]|uniref:Uncharacterized protein n=2 Tax=Leisingera daeponensis TaxID=405746 RepID=A0ABS7NDQ4_9RHOB|nr:hypothetical protein [Leisingera daeponensis]MBY6138986.1 hypothetical protein [Leisingera daeponensis]
MRLMFAACAAALAASPALADYWSYKDWHVATEPHETEQDSYLTCRAWTGGDGDPLLALEVFSGDAGPPARYPMAKVQEYAPRHYPTLMQQGGTVDFIFDFDRTFSFAAGINSWISEEGLAEAESALRFQDHLPMLQAMKQGRWVEIWAGTDMFYEASLSGFTAAYGKMMDECGFDLALPAG